MTDISERKFQSNVIHKLEHTFPGCLVYKMDANYRNGTPDLLILYKDTWAALEVKKSCNASHRPNQDYYVDLMNSMSFAAFIFPENEEEVFDGLRETFGRCR